MKRASLTLTRLLPADIGRVFDACTRPELMALWLVCREDGAGTAENSLEIGGAYRVQMARGGEQIGSAHGKYLEIDPPHRLVFTWSSDNAGVRDSIVTIELREIDRGTELILTHTLDPDTSEGRSHARGWSVSLSNLDRFLGGGR